MLTNISRKCKCEELRPVQASNRVDIKATPRTHEPGVREITKRSRDRGIQEGIVLSDRPTPVQPWLMSLEKM